tara:strand:- start:215 stop:3361 length:3147 start_codon:yes stop_codon:yes gene_type:complete
MTHWLIESAKNQLENALHEANRIQLCSELLDTPAEADFLKIERAAETYEMAVLDLLSTNSKADEKSDQEYRKYAENAFRLYRVLPTRENNTSEAELRLKLSSLAVIADKGADASRLLKENPWPSLPNNSEYWQERVWASILEIWLLLIRKDGWDDRDLVLLRIHSLRDAQKTFENEYLNNLDTSIAKQSALELIALYHLAKAAEILALYITDGQVEGNFQIPQLLNAQFDRVLIICSESAMLTLEPLARILSVCALQMVENSIWTVTRAVNSRVTQFVKELVDRGRGSKAIFDVLPPQRRTLAEKGLLGSSRRAVVVSLPTSSGKTLIAQFRMLQALNQFDHEKGWVVYLAPTRTLVNQITRKIRRDFAPLNINVERVSPALEVDSIEASLLSVADTENQFRVLVTTPEKLDLMLRQGWEKEIGRPLTLVIVDEAHNIQDANRGLKLELLLSTINKECQRAQFLLLTPFVQNAREVARWLGGINSEDVSLALDWQPNDRAIGIVSPIKTEVISGSSYDYDLQLETVHTSRNTIDVSQEFTLTKNPKTANTYSKVTNSSALAAISAKGLAKRGPVIVMHARPDWVWSLAERIRSEVDLVEPSDQKETVKKFLALEFGADFQLIELLSYGIGVHHSGLSDDARLLMEWLFENGELNYLVATTTIAQGVNFPVTGVVMASHQYPTDSGMRDMPPEDFWNIAGRAGRVDQGKLGIVALTATDDQKKAKLKTFINKQAGDLNSALISMVLDAGELIDDLGRIVYLRPEWSSFVQYLAHTYRQMGKPDDFLGSVEQVLRGTFGFEKLRELQPDNANRFIASIESYVHYLQEPGQPLSLVDSTGFSLQSIKTVLQAASQEDLGKEVWLSGDIFSSSSTHLEKMMGVILRVPELRHNLEAVTGGNGPDGEKLALILKDWVGGEPVPAIANKFFGGDITSCGRNLFGRLSQTASWGLGALLSITGSELSNEEFGSVRNLPSQIFYGVNDDRSIILRLLGIPRSAATKLPLVMGDISNQSLTASREQLMNLDPADWRTALGTKQGDMYHSVWRILEDL